MQYEAKPETIKAIQFNDNSAACALLAGLDRLVGHVEGEFIVIHTARGAEIARAGDYIVRHPCGDVRVMAQELFERLYEPALSWRETVTRARGGA